MSKVSGSHEASGQGNDAINPSNADRKLNLSEEDRIDLAGIIFKRIIDQLQIISGLLI